MRFPKGYNLIVAHLLLIGVTIERLAELWLSNRNTKVLLKNGGFEISPGHYPFIVLLHALWLAGLWYLGWNQPLNLFWLFFFLVLQIFRVWVLATLGKRWTTRIIVTAGSPLVATGPYRYLQHPNYLIVAGEIATLPLCFGLGWYCALFSVANLALLTIRLRAENGALAGLRNTSITDQP